MPMTIALLGALDTKGAEYGFVCDCIKRLGHQVLLVDVGVLDQPTLTPDVTREEVACAGGSSIADLASAKDRGSAVATMSRGAASVLQQLHRDGRFDGVLAMGGTGGTSMACAALRELPLGVPKVMVSTVAGGDVSGYVGASDIVMIPSIVDVAGVNKVSREVFARAAAAVCAMAETRVPETADRPVIVASMFGNTTQAVETARKILEADGYEVLVFHCTGTGGRMMEKLIEAGQVSGVLDLTTTEWADQVVGGVFDAGPNRCGAAAKAGTPAIVAPGCIDMVNFWAPDTVPPQFKDRLFYPHNPNVTLMRTTVDENKKMACGMAKQLNQSTGPVTVLVPTRGVSMIDAEGGPFWNPEANQAFIEELRKTLRDDIEIVELDVNVNDAVFAERCARQLLENIAAAKA